MKLHAVQQHRYQVSRYLRPASVPEALQVLAAEQDRARIIAGGTDLLLELTRGQRAGTDTLIDVSRLDELNRISSDNGELIIGAGVTHNEVVTSPVIVERALPLAQASWEIASPQIRNRATVVGNVITASPANDTITPLRALGTTVQIESHRGTREVDLGAFHLGVRQIDLRPDEMVTALKVRSIEPDERGIFVKLGLRKAQAISVVHLALVLGFEGDLVRSASVALGSVAPTIVLAPEAAAFLVGRRLDRSTIAQAATLVAEAANPIGDLRGTAEYRTAQLEVAARRALEALAGGLERRYWPARPLTLGRRRPASLPPVVIDDTSSITARINGLEVSAGGGASRTLLDWLRDAAGPSAGISLTGTKEGCAEGECGACTVYLDGVAVMACLVPAARADRAEIVTIEGLATEDGLHPLQAAFLREGAVQCGFCIPGFIMSGAMLLAERPSPTEAETRIALSGNLCRCTGYYKIMRAVAEASPL